MAKCIRTRLLSVVLILQQFLGAAPAQALNLQGGKPLDSGAIDAANAQERQSSGVTPNLFTGDATMDIPIIVPPGTGGLTPGVALTYGSGRADGPLGIGWSLAIGSSVIQRSTRNGAPAYDTTDTFELDGERLKATATAGRYVTESFDHSRIEHIVAGGDYWRVLRPDGVRLYFGYHYAPSANPPNRSQTPSVQVQAYEGTPAACGSDPFAMCTNRETIIPAGIPFSWHLDRVEDRNGNVVRLRWDDLGDPGARYLVEISWSEHVGGAVTAVPSFGGANDATLARTRLARFLYDNVREDRIPTYRNGFRTQLTHRLNEIRVDVDGVLSRHYKLAYEYSPASGRSRLTQVADHGNAETAAAPLIHSFSYGNGGTPGWTTLNTAYALPNNLEFVSSNGEDRGIRLIDVNSDGYPDVIRGDSGTRRAYLGGPSGFSTSNTTAWQPPYDFARGPGYTGVEVGDFNGDGRPDLMERSLEVTGTNATNGPCGTSRQHEVGDLTANAWLNTGTGWSASTPPGSYPYTTSHLDTIGTAVSCPSENLNAMSSLNGINVSFDQATRVADFNADGRDDLIFKRSLVGAHRSSGITYQQYEARAGTLLNTPSGLASGTFNNAHYALTEGANLSTGVDTMEVDFAKMYGLPRWQVPFFTGDNVDWSSFNTCKLNNETVNAHSGKERIVDVNADGLPDFLEAIVYDPGNGVEQLQSAEWINNGYGWQAPDSGFPESDIYAPYFFYYVVAADVNIQSPSCIVVDPGYGEDFGRRMVDVNGDGAADFLGAGTGAVTMRWDARMPELIPGVRQLWTTQSAWNTPVSFWIGEEQDPGARFADVDADGMVDILVSGGAHLNRGEPPDRLATATNPYGSVTTLTYAPSTDYETAPISNPTASGQRHHEHPVWVLDRIETNPGAAFGQPTMVQEFEYYGATYDEADRAFRGFDTVVAIGPTTGLAQRSVTTTSFYTRDELQGLPFEIKVARAPASNLSSQTVLYRTTTEYAAAPGSATTGTVYFPNGTTQSLSTVDNLTQTQAFTPYRTLLNGSPQAAEAFFALPIASEVIVTEGTAVSAVSRTEQSFDVYGNAIQRRQEGDPGDATDDVTTVTDYAIRDGIVGSQQVLLTNRPSRVEFTGVLGSLPAGTVTQRIVELFYDGQTAIGDAIVRGNANAVRQRWVTGPTAPTWVRLNQTFDVYGNVTNRSFPFDESGPVSPTSLVTTWDIASRTFPISFATSVSGQAGLSHTTSFQFDLASGCGNGPRGMGLVCARTSPTGATVATTYDLFGREVETSGPLGLATFTNYFDSARGTVNQRTEVRTRWDAAAGLPAGDADALIDVTYFDGLDRDLKLTKRGRGSDLATATISYDAAGHISQATRWAYVGSGPATTYQHDVLGRLTRRTQPEAAYTEFVYSVVNSGSPALPRRQVQTNRYDGVQVHKRAERTDAFGRLAAVDEYPSLAGSPLTTTYAYDPFDHLVRVKDAVANNSALCSGLDANCATQRHETVMFYDELGKRVRLDEPDSGTWLTKRDARGLPIETTDPRGIIHSNTYDALARLERRELVSPPDANVLDHVYTYAPGNHSVAAERGQLIRIDDQEGYETFSYDLAGNLSFHSRVLAGKRYDFTHTYDPLGRKITTAYPDGDQANWIYDKRLLARISQASGPDHVSNVQYDALDRVASLGLGGSTGSPIVSETRTYDATSGRLDVIAASAGATTLANLDYDIDGVGRVEGIVHSSLPTTGSLVTRNYGFQYDALDRLTFASGPYASGETIAGLTYSYDALGNLRKKDDGGSGWPKLEYNDPNRPHAFTAALDASNVSQREYTYDAAGNIQERRSRTSPTAWNVSTAAHDPLGNMTSINGVSAATMGYDASSRRVRLTSAGASIYFPEPDFEYLASGSVNRTNKEFFVGGRRVVSVSKNWTPPNASAPVGWTWRGPDLPDVPAWAWALLYANALGGLAVLAWRRRRDTQLSPLLRGTTLLVLGLTAPALIGGSPPPAPTLGTHADAQLFYVTDHLGSTVVAVRQTGTVRNRYTYEPFGDPMIQEGSDIHDRFTGGHRDPNGMYALGLRYYDPELGRFTQPDPIVADLADPQTHNRYAYALGNPVRWIDPNGLFTIGGDGEEDGWDWGIIFPSPTSPGPSGPPAIPDFVGNVPKGFGSRPIGMGIMEGEGGAQTLDDYIRGQIPGGIAGEIIYDILVGDIVENIDIIRNPESSTLDKVIAGADLITEIIPQKKILKAVERANSVYKDLKKLNKARKLRKEFPAARRDYWKREAAENPSSYSPDDMSRMEKGKPPIGPDGHPMELHHKVPLEQGGTNDLGNLEPLSRTDHRLGENFSKNHPR